MGFFLFLIIFFLITVFIAIYSVKEISKHDPVTGKILNMYFDNVQKVYTTSDMSLYTCDKSGENFLIALKFSSTPVSNIDLSTIYDVSEKNHLHNKVLIINGAIKIASSQLDILYEFGIKVYNNFNFQDFIKSLESNSILKTSDTSDDKCEIEETNNPIKCEKRGLLSFLKNKSDRL